MQKTERTTVAIIDDMSLYTFNLYRALERFPLTLFLYAPKSTPIGKYKLNYEVKGLTKTWSSHLHPLQIAKAVAADKVQLLDLQFEFNTFGSQDTLILVPFLLLLLKSLRKRTVTTLHAVIPTQLVDNVFINETSPNGKKIPPLLYRIALVFFYRTISLLSDALIVHYETLKKWLAFDYKIDVDKVYVIPHGISERTDRSNEERLDFWNEHFEGSKIILFFGVLSPRKGLEYLIEAYSKLAGKYPNYRLVIAGEEPTYYPGYRSRLKKLARAHMISASGPLSFAIQYKKPIIAAKNQIFDEEFEDGETALLVAPRNAKDLAEAIETLIINDKLKKELVEKIASRAKEKTWIKVAQGTYELYPVLNGTNECRRKPVQYGNQ